MNKHDLKQYKKQHKTYVKELIKTVKQDKEYEWSYMIDTIVSMLQGRLDFYSAGINVFMEDKIRLKVVEQIKTAIALFNDATTCLDTCQAQAEGNITQEEFELMLKQEDKAFADAFKYLGKYLRRWWD